MPRIRPVRKLLVAISLLLLVGALAACGGTTDSDTESGSIAAPPTEPPAQIPAGSIQAIQHLEATSKDGVLFDLNLALPVFDQNGKNGRRDDVEIITPGKTEYQGIFNDGPGTLLIVSCLADVCQTDAKTATFEVHYWVESFPDPIPDGVDFVGG